MKKIYYRCSFLLLMGVGTVLLSSCESDDVDELRLELQNHDNRISALEEWQKSVNSDFLTIRELLQRVQENDAVTDVSPLSDGSGYVLTFMKGKIVTIRHGLDGTNGAAGHNGVVPQISAKLGDDGRYYWTLNGSFLLDEAGDKVPATGAQGEKGDQGEAGQDGTAGQDGQDGADGVDGKDGVTPQLRINGETNEWEVSMDNGASWIPTGTKATGDAGEKGDKGEIGAEGPEGPQGPQGVAGPDGSPISKVLVTATSISFTINGETVVLPRVPAK